MGNDVSLPCVCAPPRRKGREKGRVSTQKHDPEVMQVTLPRPWHRTRPSDSTKPKGRLRNLVFSCATMCLAKFEKGRMAIRAKLVIFRRCPVSFFPPHMHSSFSKEVKTLFHENQLIWKATRALEHSWAQYSGSTQISPYFLMESQSTNVYTPWIIQFSSLVLRTSYMGGFSSSLVRCPLGRNALLQKQPISDKL